MQIDLYENKLKKLQEENVQIQVENSTLQSQSTSLLSQINSLQTANVTLETAKRRVYTFNFFVVVFLMHISHYEYEKVEYIQKIRNPNRLRIYYSWTNQKKIGTTSELNYSKIKLDCKNCITIYSKIMMRY